MMPILQLGPLALPLPGLIILLGIWLGLSLSEKSASQVKVKPDLIFNLAFVAILAGIVGARLAYIARFPAAFSGRPLDFLSRNPSLLDPTAGVVTGLLAAAIYGQRKRMPLLGTLDAFTPALAVMGVAFGLAHLASGSAFGSATDLPWAIHLWGESRHPSQIYETLVGLAILWLVLPVGPLKQPRPGVRFVTFVILASTARIFLEAFRGDSILLAYGIRQAQVIAWIILAISVYSIGKLQKTQRP